MIILRNECFRGSVQIVTQLIPSINKAACN